LSFIYQNSMPFYDRSKAPPWGGGVVFRSKDTFIVNGQRGVKHCFLILALLAAPALASACASAPINIGASDDSELSAAQIELREQANALADRLEQHGWAVSATPAETTRSFLGRLIGGADAVDETGSDPVALYLANYGVAQAEQDLATLIVETGSLADQALSVAAADGPISSADLARDIAAVERALGAVRRAKSFFTQVSERGQWQEELTIQLYNIVAAETRLAASADALAERRWAMRSGLFS
jgi:hypothetical protein